MTFIEVFHIVIILLPYKDSLDNLLLPYMDSSDNLTPLPFWIELKPAKLCAPYFLICPVANMDWIELKFSKS